MSNVVELKWSNVPNGAKFEYNGWERVPAGKYEASFLTWTTFSMGGMSRVIWQFSITDMGKFFNKVLPMGFNAKLKKRTGLRGHFKAPPKLEKAVYKITVVDVTQDYRQQPLPEQMIYSKVENVELA